MSSDGGGNGAANDADSFDSGASQAVAALAKQLSLDVAIVDRIFQSGVDHAELCRKRRRLEGQRISEATSASLVASESDPTPSSGSTASEGTHQKFRFTASVTMEQLRYELADFALERDWDQFHSPRNLALALVGEVGELCEIFQWKGEVPEGLPGWSEKDRKHLGQEMSDVLLYLLRMAHKCHVDLPCAAMDKLAVNRAKYPAKLVRGSSRKYSEYVIGDTKPTADS
eukprot:TRINITY_DN17542_c0_g1_i1.p1 TRINITY_DN17542_c0_g1~~TRINITY_DN17542_c0_g1_i1.p1  ORF type:complete len:228 (-),score=31.56 TRINITY_DN17542_c0_g1_i1:59-742(-)